MFSGIVTALGRVAKTVPSGDGQRLTIEAPDLGMDDVAIGDSICVQGVCLTVVQRDGRGFQADASAHTLSVTHGLAAGRAVNLEKALRASDRLGGHIVAGHVDGVGRVTAFEDLGGSFRLEVEVPAELSRYVARKASVTVDGVSLTTNDVRGAKFEVNLIPHTLAVTTLGKLALGAPVNVEVDLLARYVERLMAK
jgi:riboflavin synthase